jgi:hypothetical protein
MLSNEDSQHTPDERQGMSLHDAMTVVVAGMTQTAEAPVQPVLTTLQPTGVMTSVGMTKSQANAVKSAQSYIRYSSFSRSGLINQLVFEQYSVADAEFAVKFINVDWTEQAYLTAKSYLSYSSFSLPELIGQLEFEGFTTEQATTGATRAYSE